MNKTMLMPSPNASFEAPFEMLHACHERMERMLNLLGRLRAHVRVHGVDEQARQAARDVMRYFDIAAPEHHRDEELHVFPALLLLRDESMTSLVERLQHDHRLMEARWRAARAVLLAVSEAQAATAGISADDGLALDAFASLHAAHLAAEDNIAYPRAAQVIKGERLAGMSHDMMSRRGVRNLPR